MQQKETIKKDKISQKDKIRAIITGKASNKSESDQSSRDFKRSQTIAQSSPKSEDPSLMFEKGFSSNEVPVKKKKRFGFGL